MNNTKPCMKITLTDTKPSIFESKVGGIGYIPHDKDFPTDSNGNQLRLLAQIECEKIQLDGFMKTGLLQFWILNNDTSCMYGWRTTNQDGFRVIYYPEIDKTVTQDEIESKFVKNEYDNNEYYDFPVFRGGMSPVFCECGMSFEKSENQYVDRWSILTNEEHDEITGHKVGGYPYLINNDPRSEMKNGAYYDFLLFQLYSDYNFSLNRYANRNRYLKTINRLKGMYNKVYLLGNFFINSEKLKQCDFSDVLYNWDCC
ncbi:MAG: DUF1963 domain-containing protein [Ruminococcus sp.]|nr:DUF1963 domain-containing protein [Ruminococcus sp.]